MCNAWAKVFKGSRQKTLKQCSSTCVAPHHTSHTSHSSQPLATWSATSTTTSQRRSPQTLLPSSSSRMQTLWWTLIPSSAATKRPRCVPTSAPPPSWPSPATRGRAVLAKAVAEATQSCPRTCARAPCLLAQSSIPLTRSFSKRPCVCRTAPSRTSTLSRTSEAQRTAFSFMSSNQGTLSRTPVHSSSPITSTAPRSARPRRAWLPLALMLAKVRPSREHTSLAQANVRLCLFV